MVGLDEIRKAHILVVDDSSSNLLLLQRILGDAGYSAVSTTTDPTAVCDLYREHRHDLILLDLQMPAMDGFEVMRGLDAIETEGYLPVLVITAQPDQKLRALQGGAKDFLTKPFDRIEVLTRIRNMLEVRLLLRESREYGRLLEHYDRLTGLPNRTLYRDLLTKGLDRPAKRSDLVSILFVSLDRFEHVNDALGREVGGALLRAAADRLVECVGPMDTTARFEGDLFGLISTMPKTDSRGARMVANRVRDALRTPFEIEGSMITVTASIGIAVAGIDAQDADTLLKHADAALHDAIQSGGNTFRFYSSEMNIRALETLDLENALRGALGRGEFVLHYQPKMRIDTGEWSGVEALIRWNRPGHGLMQPSEFIEALEETALILPVGAWVIETACRQMHEWAESGIGWARVAVNVSGKQFLRDGFVKEVARALGENGIPPECLHFEITETSLMSEREDIAAVLRELKALGIWIAIDDFGTGYSSLAYLKRFPVDTLKIDISFIRDVTTSTEGAALAVAIINMARSLKMTVVAEGVETEPQLEFLRAHACDEIQGYYCSHPLPAADLPKRREEIRANGLGYSSLVPLHLLGEELASASLPGEVVL